MKIIKGIFILLIFISNIIPIYSSDNNFEFLKVLYLKANTLREKQKALKDMNKFTTDEFKDFVMDIIIDQSNYSFSILEIKDYEDWVIESARIAGKLKMGKTSSYLEKIYGKVKAPIIKGEILLQIAETGDKSYLGWFNYLLHDINSLHKDKKFKEQEEIIQGLVIGLGKFGDESSFDELLYCALPHYSKTVQDLANNAIEKVTKNPALLCGDIVLNSTDYDMKMDALVYAFESNSPDESKIEVFKMTLQKMLGIKGDTKIKEQRSFLLNKSVYYLGELKTSDKEIVKMIEQKWNEENDYYSIIINIESLEKIGTNDAAIVLNEKLKFLNQRKKEGSQDGFLTNEGPKVILAIIKALGKIRYNGSLEVLYDTMWTEDYGLNIKREASKSINLIMNQTK